MSNQPRWLKGFLLLSFVMYVVFWLGFSFYLVVRNGDNNWLVQRHFTPYLSNPRYPSRDDWTVYTASQDFLSRSKSDQLMIAEGFFQRTKDLAEELNFDTEELRAWFLKTAVMPVSEAPIEKFHDLGSGLRRGPISYRLFPSGPVYRISKIFFSPATFGISFLLTLGLIAIILLIFLPLRWVIRGFKTPAK